METPTLMAEPREVVGKKVKYLREQGLVPAVVYGPQHASTIQISVDQKLFMKVLHQIGMEMPLQLEWSGGQARVVIREVQMHPVKRVPVHIDFYAPAQS